MADREDLRESPGLGFLAGLRRYVERAVVRFHTPGHRGGRWVHPGWARSVGATPWPSTCRTCWKAREVPATGQESCGGRRSGRRAFRRTGQPLSGERHVRRDSRRRLCPGRRGRSAAFPGQPHLGLRCRHPRPGDAAGAAPVYDAQWDIPGPPGAAALAESCLSAVPGWSLSLILTTTAWPWTGGSWWRGQEAFPSWRMKPTAPTSASVPALLSRRWSGGRRCPFRAPTRC